MREPHRCGEECICPLHGYPLIYWPAGDEHACQVQSCSLFLEARRRADPCGLIIPG